MMNLKNVVCLFLLFNIAIMISVQPNSTNALSSTPNLRNSNTFLNPPSANSSHGASGNSTHAGSANSSHPSNSTHAPSHASKNGTHNSQANHSSKANKTSHGDKNQSHHKNNSHAFSPKKDIKKKPKRQIVPSINKVPIILVVSAPNPSKGANNAYIPFDLVTWLTVGGGVVSPLHYWADDKVIDKALLQADGVILQRSANSKIDLNGQYEKFVGKLLHKIKVLDHSKNHIPLYAIGGAFETLIAVEANNTSLSTKFDGISKLQTKLYFSASPIKHKYKLFGEFDRRDYKSFMRQPSNIIKSTNALSLQSFTKNAKLNSHYIVTSYGKNRIKQKFVASIEHKTLPIFGLFFHPHQIILNRKIGDNLEYNHDAFSVSQRFLDQIIESSRNSKYTAKLAGIYKHHHGIDITENHKTEIVEQEKAFIYPYGQVIVNKVADKSNKSKGSNHSATNSSHHGKNNTSHQAQNNTSHHAQNNTSHQGKNNTSNHNSTAAVKH